MSEFLEKIVRNNKERMAEQATNFQLTILVDRIKCNSARNQSNIFQ